MTVLKHCRLSKLRPEFLFRFTNPRTLNSLDSEKKIEIEVEYFFCWVELFTAHDMETQA